MWDPVLDSISARKSTHAQVCFCATATFFLGGVYSLILVFPETYPNKPPLVRFTTEVFHPNVYVDGSICLDVLQEHWSPIQTVASILQSIQSLLADPNCDSPANLEAAKLYKLNKAVYKRRVRRCADASTND